MPRFESSSEPTLLSSEWRASFRPTPCGEVELAKRHFYVGRHRRSTSQAGWSGRPTRFSVTCGGRCRSSDRQGCFLTVSFSDSVFSSQQRQPIRGAST
jgi:hypothetical protein